MASEDLWVRRNNFVWRLKSEAALKRECEKKTTRQFPLFFNSLAQMLSLFLLVRLSYILYLLFLYTNNYNNNGAATVHVQV